MKRLFSKTRFFVWLGKAFFSRYTKQLIAGFAVGFLLIILGLKFYPFVSSLVPNKQVIGVVGNYTPTTLPMSIQNLISLGFTKVNTKGEALPSLAVSWETREEGKVYIFRLKEDIFWHDEKRFTAHDINYQLRDVKINSLDDFTVEIRLKEPFSPLPVLLSQPLFKKGLVGTGSYKVLNLKLNLDRIELISLVSADPEKDLPQLIFKFYPTEAAAVTAFKLGEVDTLQELTDIYNLASWKEVEIKEKTLQNRVETIFFNTSSGLLQEKAFRQALSYAIPDSEVKRARGPICADSWAFSEDIKVYSFDFEKAQELIKKDDFASNSASLILSTFAPYLSLAQKVARSWEKLGIKTVIQVENTIPEEFDALLTTQEIPPDPDQYPLWHSTQEATNISNLKDVRIDKLLEDGRKTFEKEQRKIIYEDFQKYLLDESPAAFIRNPTVYTISRK